MRACPNCGAEYEIGDNVCPNCGKDLPAPYETVEDEGAYGNADEVAPGTGGQAEIAAVLAAYSQHTGETWVDLGTVAFPEVSGVDGQLNWAGVKHAFYPPVLDPNFRQMRERFPQDMSIHLIAPETNAGAAWQVLHRTAVRPEQLTILSGAEVFLTDTSFNPGTVVIAEGKIIEVLNFALDDPQDGSTFIDLTGKLLAPGFIDIHTHGMLGIDTNLASTADFQRWSTEAARFGTTTVVPTTVACGASELRQVLENLRAAREAGEPGTRLLGVHLESNFISPAFKGAQPEWNIFPPDDPRAEEIKALLDEYSDEVTIVTLAPETSGALELIPWLNERGIIASMGHSSATYDEAIAGIDAGVTHATHLFNAMPPLHHRNPGLIGAALERDEVFTEMICDGIHIHPAVVSTVITAKGPERFMPVTDSLQGAGMTAGEFELGGQHVTIQGGVARLDSGTIAGSITTMDKIVRFLTDTVGWDLGEAVMMVTTTAADGLGREDLGRIAQGAIADLVVLDQELQVEMTLVNGKTVYQR